MILYDTFSHLLKPGKVTDIQICRENLAEFPTCAICFWVELSSQHAFIRNMFVSSPFTSTLSTNESLNTPAEGLVSAGNGDRIAENKSSCHLSLIDRIASDAVLESAFQWLCEHRAHYHFNADVWQVRRWWHERKPLLQDQLRSGCYRFRAVQLFTLPVAKVDFCPPRVCFLRNGIRSQIMADPPKSPGSSV
jgi:hypothetical protein